MPSFADFIGSAGSSAEQLFIWQVLGQIVGAVMLPFTQALTQTLLRADPNTPLDANIAAAMVAQGLLDQQAGLDQALKIGINADNFAHMVEAARGGPDLSAAVAAFQRGLIPQASGDITVPSLDTALTQSGLRTEWHDMITALAVQIPSIAEVMNAWLEGQITEDEARTRYLAAGGDPTWFQTSYNANGQPPTPSQALELLNRGIIPESGVGPDSVSYEQAFLEGPWRNKWLQPFLALRYYYPPPRTVTAMYHAGQLTHDQAAHYLTAQGLDQTLVAAYLSPSHSSTATASEKHLAKTDIISAYTDKIMTKADALTALEALKYSAQDATVLLELADLKISLAQVRAGVNRIRTLYQSGTISATEADSALQALGSTPTQAIDLIDTWKVSTSHATRELSAAQIENAAYYDLISKDDALARLVGLGYDEADAWLALAVRQHSAVGLPPRPPSLGPAPVPPKVTP